MGETLFDFFSSMGKEFAIFIVSMIPFVELRGAIPIGALYNMNPFFVYFLAVFANILPVPFLILLARPIFSRLKNTKLFAPITHKLEAKMMKKADKIMKYSAFGLCLFVAVPLPGTGAWSGAVIASLLDMRMKYALPSISLGVAIAGVIMTIISYGVRILVF